MIRSNRSVRRLCALVVAMLAFAAAIPAAASAQSVSPTDEQYREGVLGAAAGGGADDDGTGASDDGSGSAVDGLPFTGLDVIAVVAIGVGLIGAGFVVRRAARENDARLS